TRALLSVPLVRAGRLRALLNLHMREPRAWTAEEAELVQEVAARTWAEVERARAEVEVRESEARFRSIADSAPVLVWVTAADRSRAFVNRTYVDFFGGDYRTALTADWRSMLHPDDIDRVLAESIAGEASLQPFALEARYLHHDGSYRWLRSYSRPRLDGSGVLMGFVGMAYDVTEAKQVATDLTHINELLEERVSAALAEKAEAEAALMHAQKMEAVGRLTGGVAHDFNNLLTVVIGALDMIMKPGVEEGRRRKMGEAALAAARRGERLTHQLLAFSRRQTLRPQLCDVNALIREGEPLLRRAVGEAVALKLKIGKRPAFANVDPGQFEAALLNLLVNARDATPDGGHIRIQTTAVTLAERDVPETAPGDYVCILVEDTGAGMTAEVLQRVFEPFFTTKAVGKGTGLGLSQVYGFARQSGGGVRLESAPGEGAAVRLFLPARPAATAAVSNRLFERQGGDGERLHGLHALLVEDDDGVGDMAAIMLENLGISVQRAADAAEALDRLERTRFDLMLSDVVMPGGVSGFELARRAAAHWPDMLIVLSSGYAGDEAIDAELATAPWPFLRKPYAAEE
ncbi:MAG TPA: ATP-binding protein, partial [Caulobacteraceae bacterium]